jgi:hypothetical protein
MRAVSLIAGLQRQIRPDAVDLHYSHVVPHAWIQWTSSQRDSRPDANLSGIQRVKKGFRCAFSLEKKRTGVLAWQVRGLWSECLRKLSKSNDAHQHNLEMPARAINPIRATIAFWRQADW